MKKLVVLMAVIALTFVGCKSDETPAYVSEFDLAETEYEDTYSFPEPTIQIKVTRSSRGEKRSL